MDSIGNRFLKERIYRGRAFWIIIPALWGFESATAAGTAEVNDVSIRRGQGASEPSEITVDCPTKLALDAILLEFGLTVVRGET
ncbi:hypothetical protein R1flu_027184 [Riccia fluitans]|uniref:Uncharacterized protein n=1 Tax=Riccia fluitans TaxID=41844 RepID=A0ABD1XL08_9MARC